MKKLLLTALLVLVSVPAMAHLKPGAYEIVQRDEVIGEVYVVQGTGRTASTTEHWVYYPDPDWIQNPNAMVLVPVESNYRSATEFLRDISKDLSGRGSYFKVGSVQVTPIPSP